MNNKIQSQHNQTISQLNISQQERKKQEKEIKNARHRKYVLNEWIDTEKSYIKDLGIILTKIRDPIIYKKLISDDDIRTLFSNIDIIISLSTKLLQDLESFKQSWDPNTTLIAPSLLKFYNFIKIYKEYCNKFVKGQRIMATIKKKKPQQYKEIEKDLALDIESYLIKPVQRPPKYMLLLRDYQNHMSNQHPDYNDLTIAIKKYHEMNEINNQAIQRESKRQRMFQLSKINPELLTSTRELIDQYQGSLFQKTVKIYVFNDLIMITLYTQQLEVLNKAITIDSFSFCRQIPNGKYFKNKLFICGKYQSIHVTFFGQNTLNNIYKTICSVIQKLFMKDQERKSIMSTFYSKPKIPVKVIVTLATKKQNIIYENRIKATVHIVEKRKLSVLSQQILFILKIQFPTPWNLCQYIEVTYNQIQQLEGELRKRFPGLQLPNLRPMADLTIYDQKKNGSKVIELRCLIIEQFINFLFRNPRILSTVPNFAMEQLKIQQNLWWLSIQTQIQKCKCNICENARNTTLQSYIKQRQAYIVNQPKYNDKYCLHKYTNDINAISKLDIKMFDNYEKILTFLQIKQKRIQYNHLPNRYRQLPQEYQIRVHLLNLDNQFIDIKIHKKMTISQVMDKICKDFQIYNMNQFGLFVQYYNDLRLMDRDEIIFNVMYQLDYQLKQIQKKKGFFQKFWKKQQNNTQKSKIFMKKYIFLSSDLQYKNNMSDIKKFKLIIDQAFYFIRQEIIILEKQEILQVSALYICLLQAQKLNFITIAHFPVAKIKNVLPKSKTSLADDKKWIQKVFNSIQKNKEDILKSNDKYVNIYEIIFFVVKDKIKWYSNAFQLVNKKPETLEDSSKEIIICVNYKNIVMMRKNDNKIVKTLPIKNLSYYVTAKSLYINTQDIQYRFDGKMLFSMSKLIDQYKLFHEYFPHYAQK